MGRLTRTSEGTFGFAAVVVLVLALASTPASSSAWVAPSAAAPPSPTSGNHVEVPTVTSAVEPEDLGEADFRLAMGSCSRHDRPQSLWGAIRGMRADAFLWMGDVIYADTKAPNKTRIYLGNDYLVDAYRTQNAHPEYAALTRETRILGTW